ncbi:MAG: PLP-dependent aminotransferase family protein [Flavobacterium sp.]|jgi:GntR family transcriptional regulator/MocR family aminotransferase|uniref:aminotransferase-like domain-containing protein n=1 Tax=Flavobacterium sp. TaxID=239 RepID=UPI001B4E5708|nr:PLP-dependent aminotransferase family protein [Flavobacterium sp.]MBP6145630.1 PLP-dependent aminotransferase family protein [Flavobacterium sp.]MBP7182312.1 PLP-dependent aminotransferase family protein [Flavobacterium sp.]MBP7318841.1 PLP-dependent aminotransferase family protein [Flavobacterium sp.]MBP8888222.1 PLP-dependent aminotransferase family protein [Flavobacterium sp.]HRL71377.1 PLP-dependent aminotransferase family protein [Flavobacterium sp.]
MTDSPVNTLLKKLIHFEKSSATPVYIQISQQIINAIQRSYLAGGTLLPGTRVFSQLIQINRNTAVAVYDELASQSWVDIIANKGTFVSAPEQKTAAIKAGSNQIGDVYNFAEATGFPFQTSFHLSSTQEFSEAKYELNDGQPDLRLHPIHEFSKWYSAAMKRKSLISKWNQNKKTRYSVFENQLCNYLNATRGLHIKPKNVISTRSTEMSLYIISQLLIRPKEVVLVGNLSNYAANMIFQQSGASIKKIPVDEQGLNVDYIRTHFTKGAIRCVYICTNRDYPTTVSLSAERRLKLLQLAKEYQFAIIEDDYDYDFQFEGLAMLPMASGDANGVVIYLGKLGQSLFPSFQTGFVVAPENLISEAKNYLQMLDRQGDLTQEQMLSELIYEGEIHRLLKKNVLVYKQRRDFLYQCLEENFKNAVHFKKPTGGLALWLQFNTVISLVKLSEQALKYDLFLSKTILYQDKNTCAIRLGFGHLNEEEIEIIVKKLKQAYDCVLN